MLGFVLKNSFYPYLLVLEDVCAHGNHSAHHRFICLPCIPSFNSFTEPRLNSLTVFNRQMFFKLQFPQTIVVCGLIMKSFTNSALPDGRGLFWYENRRVSNQNSCSKQSAHHLRHKYVHQSWPFRDAVGFEHKNEGVEMRAASVRWGRCGFLEGD